MSRRLRDPRKARGDYRHRSSDQTGIFIGRLPQGPLRQHPSSSAFLHQLLSAMVEGLRSGAFVARNTPSAQTMGVLPCLSLTSRRSPCSTRNARCRPRRDSPRRIRCQAHGVRSIDVRALRKAQIHCFELRGGSSVKVCPSPVNAGRGHQRRGSRKRGKGGRLLFRAAAS